MPRNPRRMALLMLQSIKRNVTDMVRMYDERQTVWDVHNRVWRKRQYDEQVENNPMAWWQLIKYTDAVIQEAESVREHAQQQYAKTTHIREKDQ